MASSEEQSIPTSIPAPPDFPVEWDDPADAALFWTLDRVHTPRPLPPLSFALARYVYEDGLGAAAGAYELPIRSRVSHINYYLYLTIFPIFPPEEMEAQGKRAEARLGESIGRLPELWSDEWLPEVHQILNFWDDFDLQNASMPDLLVHLDTSIDRYRRLWDLHFQIVLCCFTVQSMFEEMFRDLFQDASALDAYRLLQGYDNITLQANRALWQLSRSARASDEVRRALEEAAPATAAAALEGVPQGPAFLGEFQAYLEGYGRRTDQIFDISVPYWIEDSAPTFAALKDYLSQPDRDVDAELTDAAAEREQLVAETMQRLSDYPQPVIDQFEFFLRAAQEATIIREDHNFWIDFQGPYLMRQVALEFGRRFAQAGVIAEATDIFELTLEEIQEVDQAQSDLRELVSERRLERERFEAVIPPAVVGTLPPGPPPDDPVGLAISKVLGVPAPPMSEPNVLRGVPASRGVTQGRARVIHRLEEADRLQQGEILVAESTLPPWTPLFAIVAAAVTDTGGALSHAAIVAREYGIPAVVGTDQATRLIRDGQMIEVDGDRGTVRIIV